MTTLIDATRADLRSQQNVTEQSVARFSEVLARFAAYLERGHAVSYVAEITADQVRGFVLAPASTGAPPSIATTHLRRAAVRLLFRNGRRLGWCDGDPTLDLRLPQRSSLHARPLTDDEVALCRNASLTTLTETRLPAAWALAEASARTSEISEIRASDLNLVGGRLWLHGGSKTLPRWGELTEWGRIQLARRLETVGTRNEDRPLIYKGGGSAQSRQASACAAITEVLRRAGLAEPDVRPASVPAWAGASAFAAGASIEEVASLLGVRSLDRAARLIGRDARAAEEP